MLQAMGIVRDRKADIGRRVRLRRETCRLRRVAARDAFCRRSRSRLPLHRMVVVARCDSTDSTASAMIETLGAK